jgi:hypothetical protein
VEDVDLVGAEMADAVVMGVAVIEAAEAVMAVEIVEVMAAAAIAVAVGVETVAVMGVEMEIAEAEEMTGAVAAMTEGMAAAEATMTTAAATTNHQKVRLYFWRCEKTTGTLSFVKKCQNYLDKNQSNYRCF